MSSRIFFSMLHRFLLHPLRCSCRRQLSLGLTDAVEEADAGSQEEVSTLMCSRIDKMSPSLVMSMCLRSDMVRCLTVRSGSPLVMQMFVYASDTFSRTPASARKAFHVSSLFHRSAIIKLYPGGWELGTTWMTLCLLWLYWSSQSTYSEKKERLITASYTVFVFSESSFCSLWAARIHLTVERLCQYLLLDFQIILPLNEGRDCFYA